jgi:sec-independent protein translocase protein TatC
MAQPAQEGLVPAKPETPPDTELRETLVEHLDELRTRVLRVVGFVSLGWVAGYFFQMPVYGFLARPLLVRSGPSGNVQIVFNSFTEPFLLKLQLAFMIGLVAAAPFVILQVWGFVRPGLTKPEQKLARILAPMSVLLFLFGIVVAWSITPFAFRWFLSYLEDYGGAKLFQNPRMYVLFLLKMGLAFGAAFQLPVVLVILSRLGLVTEAFLWKHWRHAFVIIAFCSMVLSPSNDAFTMLMMFIPMCLLYFGSITAIRVIGRPARGRAGAAGG